MLALQNVDQENRAGAAAAPRASTEEQSVLQTWKTSLKREENPATSDCAQPASWVTGNLGHHAQSLAWQREESKERAKEKEISKRLTLQIQSVCQNTMWKRNLVLEVTKNSSCALRTTNCLNGPPGVLALLHVDLANGTGAAAAPRACLAVHSVLKA